MNIEEIQKLSDRDLLVKTYGKVERMEGILTGGNSGGLVGDISELKKNQNTFVTKNMLVLIISISAGIWIPTGVFLSKLLGYW